MSNFISLSQEEVGKVAEWVQDWEDAFVPVRDIPASFDGESIGQAVIVEREGFGRIEFVRMGVTIHTIGHPEITGTATRVDLIAHDGSAYPIKKGDKVYLNGELAVGQSETG